MSVTEPYDFFIAPVRVESDGGLTSEGYVNIEDAFKGLRYKSVTGLDSYGATRHYSESFAESDVSVPYLCSSRGGVDVRLTLYFFCPFGHNGVTEESQIYFIERLYHEFVSFVDGRMVLYYDTARKRKCLMYQDGEISPKTMKLKGVPYYEVEIPFKSVNGHASIAAWETYPDVSGDVRLSTYDNSKILVRAAHLSLRIDAGTGDNGSAWLTLDLSAALKNFTQRSGANLKGRVRVTCERLGVKNVVFEFQDNTPINTETTELTTSILTMMSVWGYKNAGVTVTDDYDGYISGTGGVIEKIEFIDFTDIEYV